MYKIVRLIIVGDPGAERVAPCGLARICVTLSPSLAVLSRRMGLRTHVQKVMIRIKGGGGWVYHLFGCSSHKLHKFKYIPHILINGNARRDHLWSQIYSFILPVNLLQGGKH